jgi:hypothetical protein
MKMHYRFHVNVFARPDSFADGDATARDAYLPISFEQAMEELSRLPRIDAEPDGFFVVSGDAAGKRWQVSGHLFDFGGRLHRVELHGDCPRESFDAILACLGWPAAPLLFELVMEGVALDEAAFRQWAQA